MSWIILNKTFQITLQLLKRFRGILLLGLSFQTTRQSTLIRKRNYMTTYKTKTISQALNSRESVWASMWTLHLNMTLIWRYISMISLTQLALLHTVCQIRSNQLMCLLTMPPIWKVTTDTHDVATRRFRIWLLTWFYKRLQVIRMHLSQFWISHYLLKHPFQIRLLK